MYKPSNKKYKNELLRRLNQEDLDLIEPYLVRSELPLRTMLENRNSPIEFVYFLEDGIGSIVAKMPMGRDTEVGLIGFEGMTGTALVLGDDQSTHECYVQLAGEAHRLPADRFLSVLSQSETLRPFLLRYVQLLFIQTGYTALVNARSKLEERLARWLLMCDDRVAGDRLTITHEFLAIMLGVHRPTVTLVLGTLQQDGLISTRYGRIRVLRRRRLQEASCECYDVIRAHFRRLGL